VKAPFEVWLARGGLTACSIYFLHWFRKTGQADWLFGVLMGMSFIGAMIAWTRFRWTRFGLALIVFLVPLIFFTAVLTVVYGSRPVFEKIFGFVIWMAMPIWLALDLTINKIIKDYYARREQDERP
jgi:hypothetical protein